MTLKILSIGPHSQKCLSSYHPPLYITPRLANNFKRLQNPLKSTSLCSQVTRQTHQRVQKMGHNSHDQIAYAFTLAFLSTSLVVLALALIFLCKKQPVESEETLPITIRPSTRPYPLTAIDLATDGFNPRQVLGKGRLGTTYVAALEGGLLVAAKRIHPCLVLSHTGFGFSSMIKRLSLAQHPHIIPIVGYSEGPGERIILTELISTLSLDQFYLNQDDSGQGEPVLLDWAQRVRIAAGVARGLEYLHAKMAPPVVHGSVRPSNILVDAELRARVCDFGLGFLAPPKEKDAGLVGYVDDEYWVVGTSGGACKESDVYGFGVVVLELLSGRRSEDGLLVKWGLPLIKEMRFGELLDPRLVAPTEIKPLLRLAKVASACVGNSRKNRPSFVEIASILNSLELEISV